ncbi:hypothetical protein R3P38DRAFT_3307732 [Favolaschia claudopus]|uniref:Uncharacterized protein n=1 Tax=Favolaschia claudopus TaxID=2862362 RepID=A0AAW0D663_9AGAR
MNPAQSGSDVDTETNVEAKPATRTRKREVAVGLLSKLWGAPGLVVGGQFLLQVIAWTFFCVVWAQGLVAIPSLGFPKAVWLKPLAFLFTSISHGLAFVSTFLFSWGVQQSLILDLRTVGMPFQTFLSGMYISSQAVIPDLRSPKWTALSLIAFALCSQQTSGWNTLLTPQTFVFDDVIGGREADLSSSGLKTMFAAGALDGCVYNSSRLISMAVGQTESGYSALHRDPSFPTSLTFLDHNFNTSTAGIFPMLFNEQDSNSWFPHTTGFPASLSQPSISFRRGLSWTSTINQQGFTADVSCKFQNLTPSSTPSLTIRPNSSLDGAQSSPSLHNITSPCAAPGGRQESFCLVTSSSAYAFVGQDAGYLLMIACQQLDSIREFPPEYFATSSPFCIVELIFVGSGVYTPLNTTICTLTPKVTNVRVDYAYAPFSDTINATTLSGGVVDIDGPAAMSAVATIYNTVSFSQAVFTNIVGNQIQSVLGEAPVVSEYSKILVPMVLRACLSAHNGTFLDGIPNNMTIQSSGRLHTQFFGWQFTTSSCWILIPGTLIAIATIYIVLETITKHWKAKLEEDFDPSDPLDLVAVSAAGGLEGIFVGAKEERVEAAKKVNLVLRHIPGQGLGFQHRA